MCDRVCLIKMGTLVRLLQHPEVTSPLPKTQRFDFISQTSFQMSSISYIVLANHTQETFIHHKFGKLGHEHPKNNKKRKSILLFSFFLRVLTKLKYLSSNSVLWHIITNWETWNHRCLLCNSCIDLHLLHRCHWAVLLSGGIGDKWSPW